jgi:aminopeptidase N
MNKLLTLSFALLLIYSCGIFNKSSKKNNTIASVVLDSVEINPTPPPVYQASSTRKNDILHTKLEVRFDWSKSWLYGKATITAQPYFYPVNTIELDARGFDISEVSLVSANDNRQKLEYKYAKEVLTVMLDKQYTRSDTFRLYIEYTAKPNELAEGGSAAINSDKGLYFINPEGKDKAKPQQVWTQGETQANSAWFPTIDRPNERMTNEIYMTVDKKYSTLSNGELVFQADNGDGTRTDCWKMDLPHAPYLVMMAVGEFAVVKDKWRDKEVSYYVEKPFEAHARAIFANTPEMLEFFSNKLGVAYPWNKYSQVVVRDYVSGAMENTTASLFGEFVQRTERELIDADNQDIVAHELFHQWFGDLVTCESWANLPLNESFATYGEYLWAEYKLGRDEADLRLQNDLLSYLMESMSKQVDMIRYYYEDKEDMFDSHSYAKGGRILHMLRKYVGDEAFFTSLKVYLEENKYTPVEIHDLRLAFEKVTGEDLNWFFDQWFLGSGHPDIEFRYKYDMELKKQTVTVLQKQKRKETPVYKLPIAIDIYYNGKKDRHMVTVTKREESFAFDVPVKPDLVNADAEKMLLCTKKENKTREEYVFQYKNAPLYLDRYEAIEELKRPPADSLAAEVVASALNDRFWSLRVVAINSSSKLKIPRLKEKLLALTKDEHSKVRAAAISALAKDFSGPEVMAAFNEALNDRSYLVLGEAMSAIGKADPAQAMKIAKRFENETVNSMLMSVARIYADHGTDEHNDFFIRTAPKISGFSRIGFITLYGNYLENRKDETINEGLKLLEDFGRNSSSKWVKAYSLKAIGDIYTMYKDREESILKKLADMKSTTTPNSGLVISQEEELKKAQAQKQKVAELYNELKALEKK